MVEVAEALQLGLPFAALCAGAPLDTMTADGLPQWPYHYPHDHSLKPVTLQDIHCTVASAHPTNQPTNQKLTEDKIDGTFFAAVTSPPLLHYNTPA